MSNFTPAPYEPDPSLSLLHGSSRLSGGNQLNLQPGGAGIEQDGADYLVGVAAGPMVMVVMFFVWMLALCCVGCCKRRVSCGNKPAIILFVGFMVLSCFGWFYSIGGNAQTTAGVNKVFDLGDALNEFIDLARGNIFRALDFATVAADILQSAVVSCNIPGLPANYTSVIAGIDTAVLGQIRPRIDEVIDGLKDVTEGWNEATDEVRPLLTQWQEAYVVLVSCIIALIAVLTLATVWRVWEGAPGHGSCLAACLGKASSRVFFSLGILLLLLIWVVVALLAVISTIGADLCVPSPADNLVRLASQVTADRRAPGVDICDEAPVSYLCFYTACQGTNPIEIFRDAVSSDVVDEVIAEVDPIIGDILDAIASAAPSIIPGAGVCVGALQNARTNATSIPDRIEDALGIVGCERIQPLYAGVVEQGLCNGVVAGMATTWITMVLGAVSLQAALFVYRLFEFHKYRDGKLVTASVIDEGGHGAVVVRERDDMSVAIPAKFS